MNRIDNGKKVVNSKHVESNKSLPPKKIITLLQNDHTT